MEDLPGPGYLALGSDGQTGNGAWDYVRQHKYVSPLQAQLAMCRATGSDEFNSPFASFDSINLNGSRLLNMVSFNEWHQDVEAKAVPQYAFLTPNMMNNGRNTSLEHATKWAKDFIEPMLRGGVKGRTLIVLTYDEAGDDEAPNKVMSLLLGASIPSNKKGTEDNTFYTHYSMLSTIEFNWQMPHLGRYDAGANIYQYVQDLGSKVLVPNRDPPNMGRVNNAASYPGALNSNQDKKIAYPPPNLGLKGSSGLPILQHVGTVWGHKYKENTPYDGNGTLYDASFPPLLVPQTPYVEEEEEEQEHHHDHDLHNERAGQ